MSAAGIPTPLQTLKALAKGYAPRLLQARGWVLASLPVLPVALTFLVATVVSGLGRHVSQGIYLTIFHGVLVAYIVPIMALVAAPAGIREDLEQRTLPLMLSRPAPVWALPLAKGLLWFAWGAVWLVVANATLLGLGLSFGDLPGQCAALVGVYWGELAFLAVLGLVFKRGNLWGALWLFLVEPLVRIFPGNLQRLTFVHYAESLSRSRAGDVKVSQLLAQVQISTPWALALLVLFAFGLACWALTGWKLQTTPIGLAGADAEG
ncbi:MAG TPA: hypothetical protein VJ600_02465 [Holophagaceae bacterium]|nr:hypothetical protein [Holophagaceae bacterium]